MIRLLALVAAIVAVTILLWPRPGAPPASGRPDGQPWQPPVANVTASASTPSPPGAAPELSKREINEQDDVSRGHARRVRRDLAERPLLQLLPVVVGPVSVDVAGLAPDGRTVLEVTGAPSLQDARRAYRTALRRAGDSGRAYLPRFLGR